MQDRLALVVLSNGRSLRQLGSPHNQLEMVVIQPENCKIHQA